MEEESERLRGGGDKIKFIDLRLERGEVVGFGIGRKKQDVLSACRLLGWKMICGADFSD